MKKHLILISFIFLTSLVSAQISIAEHTADPDPIVWSQEVRINKDGTNSINFNAKIEDGWHLYSQNLDADKIGPIPTSFSFVESKDYELMGKVAEGEPIIEFDPNFEMEIAMFEKSAKFSQKIKLNGENGIVKGNISFMVCNEEQCIFPPEHEFTVEVSPIPVPEKN